MSFKKRRFKIVYRAFTLMYAGFGRMNRKTKPYTHTSATLSILNRKAVTTSSIR